MQSAMSGRPYDDQAILAALGASGLTWRRSADPAAEAAGIIAGGDLVAWYQGGSQLGPRALGDRSILGDPRQPWMRDHVNDVKSRK